MQERTTETIKQQVLKVTCANCLKPLATGSTLEKCPHCGGLLYKEKSPLQPGLVVDESYQIIEQAGEGAWGTVYRAGQLSVARDVALKVLHERHVVDPGKIERFMQEARSLRQLNHEGLAAIFDVGMLNNDRPYLVQEFVSGVSLREFVKSGQKLSVEQFKTMFDRILEALQQAHLKGIIHRDIKPANIMICDSSSRLTVKLLDFGIAKLIDQDAPSLTATGDLLGTPLYMSPEQCLGEKLDGRSDLYAIGCIMHELLSGQSPFLSDNSFQCMMKHLHDPPPDLAEHGINEAYRSMIMKALEKEPDMRYHTADEFRQALDDLPDSFESGEGRPVSRRESGSNLPLALSLTVALAVALGGAWFLHNRSMAPDHSAPITGLSAATTVPGRGAEPLSLIEDEAPVKPKEQLESNLAAAKRGIDWLKAHNGAVQGSQLQRELNGFKSRIGADSATNYEDLNRRLAYLLDRATRQEAQANEIAAAAYKFSAMFDLPAATTPSALAAGRAQNIREQSEPGAPAETSGMAIFNANGKLLSSVTRLDRRVADLVFNPDANQCFALSERFQLLKVDPRTGKTATVALPDGVSEALSGIALDGPGKCLYVLSNQLLRYDVTTGTWSRLDDAPVGGAGFACCPESHCFYMFGRSNSTPGHIRNLYKLDGQGRLMQKVKLSSPLQTADGMRAPLQMRSLGDRLVAVIPQPEPAGGRSGPVAPSIVLINPENGEVLNTALLKDLGEAAP